MDPGMRVFVQINRLLRNKEKQNKKNPERSLFACDRRIPARLGSEFTWSLPRATGQSGAKHIFRYRLEADPRVRTVVLYRFINSQLFHEGKVRLLSIW